MADRFPLILNTSANQIQEIASGDTLDLSGNNIANAGIITASSFSGPVVAGAGVSNITAGIITAVTFKGDGDFVDIDVDGHTNLDNVSVAGVTTFAGNADFSAGIDVTGNITTTGDVSIPDDKSLFLGNGSDFSLIHRSSDNISIIKEVGGSDLSIETNGSKAQFYDSVNGRNMAEFIVGGACLFKHGATTRLATNSTGATVTGNATVSGNLSVGGVLTYEDVTNVDSIGIITARNGITVSSGTAIFQGAIDANGDIDVDGHTNLDNVSVAGVSTFTGNADFSSGVDVTGTLNVAGAIDSTVSGADNTLIIETTSSGDPKLQFNASGSGGHRIEYSRSTNILSFTNGTSNRLQITAAGHTIPGTDSLYDLGLTGTRWRNVYADTLYGAGSNITALNATNLSSGTVPLARLGDSGTKSATTFLAGDNTFKAVNVAINSIANDGANRLLTSDGDATATAESELTYNTYLSLIRSNSDTNFGDNSAPGTVNGIFINNSQSTNGVFSALSLSANDVNGTNQAASFIAKSVSGGYTPEVHITQRTGGNLNESNIKITSGRAVELRYQGTTKLTTTSDGIAVGSVTIDSSFNNIGLPDGGAVRFGAGEDLKIYHSGGHNYIDSANGNLNLRGANNENAILYTANSSIQLFHNNVKSLETTTEGIEIKKTVSGATARLKIEATNGGQAGIELRTSLSGTNRAARIDMYNQNNLQWSIFNDYNQNGTNDFSIKHGTENAIRALPDGDVELYNNGEEAAKTTNTNGLAGFLVGDSQYLNTSVTHGELIVRKNLASPNNPAITQCARMTIMTNEQTGGGNGYGGAVFFGGQDVNASDQYCSDFAAIGSSMDNVDLGGPTPAAQLNFWTRNGGTFSEKFRIYGNGTLQATDTSIGSLSDERLKKNIKTFEYDLEDFKALKPKTFNWIKPEYHTDTPLSGAHRGFIAQDIEKVDPELISEGTLSADSKERELVGEDAIAKTAILGRKDAMYVSVIQQLMDKIEKLETEVAALKGS